MPATSPSSGSGCRHLQATATDGTTDKKSKKTTPKHILQIDNNILTCYHEQNSHGASMNKEQTKIYLDLPPSTLEAFSDNGIDIIEYLSSAGIQATSKFDATPALNSDGRSKDLVLTLLASSASVGLIGMTIAKLLNTVFRRPQKVEYYEYISIRDLSGNVITRKDGTPIFEKVMRYEIIEPKTEETKLDGDIKLTADHGIAIKVRSATKPN